MRILITEDDMIGRRVLGLFLAPYGNIDDAESGEDALHKFKEAHTKGEPYGLICLDIEMPGQSGLDVLRQVREFEKQNAVADPSTVIMLTGTTDPTRIEAATDLGAAKCLLKPVLESELHFCLQELNIKES